MTWIDPWGLACANDGKGKKHGGEGHNKIIDKIIKDVRKEGAKEIRKNQQQVDFNGNKVGTNKPDIQYNYKGKHYNIEVDTTLKGSLGHQSIIPSRDPNARNTFWLIDKSGNILGGLSIF